MRMLSFVSTQAASSGSLTSLVMGEVERAGWVREILGTGLRGLKGSWGWRVGARFSSTYPKKGGCRVDPNKEAQPLPKKPVSSKN